MCSSLLSHNLIISNSISYQELISTPQEVSRPPSIFICSEVHHVIDISRYESHPTLIHLHLST